MKIVSRLAAAAAAVVVSAVMAVSAAADYTFSFDDSVRVDEIKADSYEIDGTQATLTATLPDSSDDTQMISVRVVMFDEFCDPSFWNNPDITVSIEVKLETEGVDVIGFIPAFLDDGKWTWVNPSEFTTLVYDEWVTISETGTHFYDAASDCGPNRMCFQVRTNWGAEAAGEVTVSIRNFTISDGSGNTVVVSTDEMEVLTSDAASTAEAVSKPSDSESDTSVSAPTTSAVVTAAAPEEEISYTPVQPNAGKDTAKVIIVIVVIAVVIVAVAVVGYIIYKKKKYY